MYMKMYVLEHVCMCTRVYSHFLSLTRHGNCGRLFGGQSAISGAFRCKIAQYQP